MLDKKKLKKLEGDFLLRYPKGFNDPEMLAIGKKHKMSKMIEFSQDVFDEVNCANVPLTADNMVKAISRSSMVSLFEKPKFRDFVKALNDDEKAFMVNGLKELLHGHQQTGFEALVDLLKTEKLAKWSLMTIIPAYFNPNDDVFVKPTTVKNVLKYFEVNDLVYKPAPTWSFYECYRELINEAKNHVSSDLSPSNAAFSGFLMMTIGHPS